LGNFRFQGWKYYTYEKRVKKKLQVEYEKKKERNQPIKDNVCWYPKRYATPESTHTYIRGKKWCPGDVQNDGKRSLTKAKDYLSSRKQNKR